MRLRGCVAIELFVGAIAAAALSGAALWGVAELRAASAGEPPVARRRAPAASARSDGAPARAADTALASSIPDSTAGQDFGSGSPAPGPEGTRLAAASISGELLPHAADQADEGGDAPPWSGQFLGRDDRELLAPLRDSPIKAVKLNRGGSSLSLRLDLESGARAACKPNQIHLHSQPRREIAAYRLNRLLGLSSVPPALGRRFVASEIAGYFRPDKSRDRARFLAEAVPEADGGGALLGELTWWVPDLAPATIEGFEIDATEGVVTWKRYLTVGNDVPPAVSPLVAQLSDMVLFDFVINNSDRWSGGNIKTAQGGRTVVFLDNTLSFGGDPNGHNRVRTYLFRAQKFSRRFVERLRQLSQERLEEALTRDIDPFPLLLEKYEVRAVLKRRDHALHYVDDLIQQHGEQAVLAFP